MYGMALIDSLQIIAEDFLENKMSVKDFVQTYKQERVVRQLLTKHSTPAYTCIQTTKEVT